MIELGFAISSEEHPPAELVKQAQRAEEMGLRFALISDHFHPWLDAQANSPFVWSTLGAIAQSTSKIRLVTGVTCPIIRIHPAIIAHAAATVAAMMPGRFVLGVGSGENLNEHILGGKWPVTDTRLRMLEEAVALIRQLWQGGLQSFEGEFYTVENARLYTLPEQTPEIYIAARGEDAATLAGRAGDGLINTQPNKEVVQTFEKNGGAGKPRIGQITMCWGPDEVKATQTAMKYWRQGGLQGPLSTELALPQYFEEASQIVRAEDLTKTLKCGPDPEVHLAAIRKFAEAGYEQVCLHQVGPVEEGFYNFFKKELMPRFERQFA